MVNDKTIKKVREAYRNRFNAILFKLAGPDALAPADLQKLIDMGLIDPEQHSAMDDAYIIARHRGGDDPRQRPKTTLKEFREAAKKHPIKLSPREEYAIHHIKQSAGNYIKKLRDNTLAEIEGDIRAYNVEERHRILNDIIQPTVTEAISNTNITVREIASRLRERTGDLHRNWKRVAVTELSNALNLGAADAIVARNHGQPLTNVFVYKLVHNDAATCPHCKRFYLDKDGITPTVYRLSELLANGSNYGKKTSEWKPVVGATHPNERCELVEIPKGWGFEEGSNRLTFMGKDFRWQNRTK